MIAGAPADGELAEIPADATHLKVIDCGLHKHPPELLSLGRRFLPAPSGLPYVNRQPCVNRLPRVKG